MVFHVSVHLENTAWCPCAHCTAHIHNGKSYPRVDYPEHPKLMGKNGFTDSHWKEHNAFNPNEKSSLQKNYTLKEKKTWLWSSSGYIVPRIQLLWSEIASNSFNTVCVTNTCPHSLFFIFFFTRIGLKKGRLWIRKRTSGAANNLRSAGKRVLAQKVYQRSPFHLSNSRKHQEPSLSWWPV